MSNLLINIKELISFYVKVNYEEYIKENKLKYIETSKLKDLISEMFDQKKEHMKILLNSSKDVLKDEYPGDTNINNIFREI